jgi:hypothetical protein
MTSSDEPAMLVNGTTAHFASHQEALSQLARFHILREAAVEGAPERKLDEDP